jgi:hypothetical protein
MRFLVQWIRRAAEARLRVAAGYITELGEASFSGFIKFLMFLPLAGHRGRTDATLLHVARLVAFRHEDCGSCLQSAINVALDEGVAPLSVAAVLDGDDSTMPPALSLIVRFTEGVLAMDGSECEPRQEIIARYGTTTLAELSLAIASARVFPTIKRGLGLSVSCAAVRPAVLMKATI